MTKKDGGGGAGMRPRRSLAARQREDFRRRLLADRDALLQVAEAGDEEIAALGAPGPGDSADRASGASLSSLVSRVAGQDKHELDEIAAALDRLDAGAYGRCEACRESISLARLRAVPAARLCLRCQTAQEARS